MKYMTETKVHVKKSWYLKKDLNYLLDPWQTYYTVDKSQPSLINQNRIDYILVSEDIVLSLSV